MSDVKKIATREAYGKTLAELGAEMQGFWTATLRALQRPANSGKYILTGI